MIIKQLTPKDQEELPMNNKEVVAQNLDNLMHRHSVTRSKLADDLGIKYSTLSDWLNGRTYPRVGAITQLATYFNVSPSAIVDSTEPSEVLQGVVSIPIIGTIAGGSPILADEHIEGYVKELKAGLPVGELFYLRVKGHSMEPTIKDGSLVLINRQPEVSDGDIAAVLINNEATLKRVTIQDGKYILIPDNKDYPPILLDRSNENRILGKAIRVTINLE
ncbi:peptidase s24-like protein [Levilactobacillus paucivorans]|uniref:Peptidase s24-like protein n=2 Tax=Levilactobacillus paucivorans TaxID=616990 RepID=A0A0R2LX04_9LACO|nr:peptidase s24-like protein [Levilactobacillus paucivorans]